MKILTVVGARPQFVKAAILSRALATAVHVEFVVHTGQHYNYEMSQVFFDELGLPPPSVNLGIGSGSHGRQTGLMLMELEKLMQQEQPEWVVVYGDTNSTLAAALAASKLGLPLAHVEAGLRSFNRAMPEEHNRVLTDHCADLLLCPSATAVEHLRREGITAGVHEVGDIMYDALRQFAPLAARRSTILQRLQLNAQQYLLATVHRPANTDSPAQLRNILTALREVGTPVVFPVHPRARPQIEALSDELRLDRARVHVIDPVGYLDMLVLEQYARCILTDSGGMQKEAYFFGVPCVTLRAETEWVETVQVGWNVLVGADTQRIIEAATTTNWPWDVHPQLYGTGRTAQAIVHLLESEVVQRGGV